MKRTGSTRPCLSPRRGFSISMLALLITLVLYFLAPDVFELGETRLLDYRMRLLDPKVPGPLVKLVLIDAKSRETYGLGSKMRFALADLIDELCAEGALAVGLDLFFLTMKQEDPSRFRLAEAVARCDRVVMGYNWHKGKTMERLSRAEAVGRRRLLDATRNPEEEGFTPEFIARQAEIFDLSIMRHAAAIGYFTVINDPYDMARKIPATLVRNGHYFFPFSLAVVRTALQQEEFKIDIQSRDNTMTGPYLKSLKLRPDPSGYLWFNHYGSHRAFEALSFDEAVKTGVPAGFAGGSIVMIGVSGRGSGDLFTTPYDDASPGVALHATAVVNALKDGFLWRDILVRALEVSIMSALALIMGIFLPRVRPVQAHFLGPTLALAFWVAAQKLLGFWAMWVQLICPMLLILLVHVGILSARLRHAERICAQVHEDVIPELEK